jgi:hypothetical protein
MPRLRDARYASALVLCAAAAAARLSVGTHIVDDAYITMRYSRNLAAAGAMSYNPPDAVLGTSTPLWTWILAAGELAGVAPEKTSVVTAFLADTASIVLILTSPAGHTLAAIVSAATIAAWPGYVTYAVSGMETSLYVLTIVGFAAALSRGGTSLAAAAASLAALCRPDGALLVVLGTVWTFVAGSRRAALRFALVAALLCAPWSVYAFVQFGSIIPASVSAKASAADPWVLSLQNLGAYFLRGIYAPITILACAGPLLESSRFFRVWSIWAWSYLVAMTAANGFTHFPWYFVPLLPIYTGAAAMTLERVWNLSRQGRADTVLSTPWVRVAVTLLLSVALLTRMPSLKAYLDETAVGREKLYASVAAELAGVDGHCTVAATEIGTIGYYYPGRVLDLVGLVSPEVVGRPLDQVLAESRARWLVTYDTHFDRAIAGSEPFASVFERRSTFPIGAARTLEIYERRDGARCGRP